MTCATEAGRQQFSLRIVILTELMLGIHRQTTKKAERIVLSACLSASCGSAPGSRLLYI